MNLLFTSIAPAIRTPENAWETNNGKTTQNKKEINMQQKPVIQWNVAIHKRKLENKLDSLKIFPNRFS